MTDQPQVDPREVEPDEPEGTPPGHEKEPGKRTGTETAPGQQKKPQTR